MLSNPKRLPEWFIIASKEATFTLKEVSELLDVPVATLYTHIEVGKFPKGELAKRTIVSGVGYNGVAKKVPMRWKKTDLLTLLTK